MLNFRDRLGLPDDGNPRTSFEVLIDFESCIAEVLAGELEPTNYRTQADSKRATWWAYGDRVDFQCLPETFILKMLSRASATELASMQRECREVFGHLNRNDHSARCAALLLGQEDLAFEVDAQLHARSKVFEVNQLLAAARRIAPLARVVGPLLLPPIELVAAWTIASEREGRDRGALNHDLQTLMTRAEDVAAQHVQFRAMATPELFTTTSQVLDAIDRRPGVAHLDDAQRVLARYRLDPARKDPL